MNNILKDTIRQYILVEYRYWLSGKKSKLEYNRQKLLYDQIMDSFTLPEEENFLKGSLRKIAVELLGGEFAKETDQLINDFITSGPSFVNKC